MGQFDKNEFGRRLRAARKNQPAKVTQSDLGERISEMLGEENPISGSSIAQWEKGTSLPTLDKLAAVCSILRVQSDTLLQLAEPSSRPPEFLAHAAALPEPLQEALLQIVSHLAEKSPSEKRFYRGLEAKTKRR